MSAAVDLSLRLLKLYLERRAAGLTALFSGPSIDPEGVALLVTPTAAVLDELREQTPLVAALATVLFVQELTADEGMMAAAEFVEALQNAVEREEDGAPTTTPGDTP